MAFAGEHCDKIKFKNQYGIPENACRYHHDSCVSTREKSYRCHQIASIVAFRIWPKSISAFVGEGILLEQCRGARKK